mgnify:CR=1 FL=1
MKLSKISNGVYSFKDAVVSSLYNKQEKTFSFTVERIGYYPHSSNQKNILVMDNQIESIYNSMEEIVTASNEDLELTDAELALADYIRSYNPDNDVMSRQEISEATNDPVLMALNMVLETNIEEDYYLFRRALASELAV